MIIRSDAKQNTSTTHSVKSVFRQSNGEGAVDAGSKRGRRSRISRGQSAVEFALISVVALVVMLVGVQYALLGQAAVALNQGVSALARYAIENPGTLGDSTGNGSVTLNQGLENLLSTTILTGTNNSDLTVKIASYQGSTTTPVNTSPQFGDRCVITMSYQTQSKIFVPNNSLGLVTLPGTLTASAEQQYQ